MKKLTVNLLLILTCGSAFASPIHSANSTQYSNTSLKAKGGNPVPTPTKTCINFPVPCDDR